MVPGAAAFALLLLMGARHYARWSHWLRSAVLVLGLVAAALALIGLAATRLFPRQLQPPWPPTSDGEFIIEWASILNIFVNPLIMLALGILADWVIVRPDGRSSGAAGLGVAEALLVVGLLGTFSAQLFPLTSQSEIIMQSDVLVHMTTWTQFWNRASPQIPAVAAAALLCAVVVRVMGKSQVFEAVEDELEPAPAKKPDA